MNKKIKTVLAFSIALNIVFISLFLGHELRKRSPEGFMKYKEKEMIEAISAEKQTLARETFEKLAKIRKENFDESKDKLTEIEKIVVAKDFDQKLFLRKMDEFKDSHSQVKIASDQEIAVFLSQLDQSDREKLVKQFKKSMKKFKH